MNVPSILDNACRMRHISRLALSQLTKYAVRKDPLKCRCCPAYVRVQCDWRLELKSFDRTLVFGVQKSVGNIDGSTDLLCSSQSVVWL